jgi:hypothetical protein
MCVADFLDQETGWDLDIVPAVFNQEDTNEILSIPVRKDMDDGIAWHFDSKGVFFSIKSAYRLRVSLRDREMQCDAGPSVTPVHVLPLWKSIWK